MRMFMYKSLDDCQLYWWGNSVLGHGDWLRLTVDATLVFKETSRISDFHSVGRCPCINPTKSVSLGKWIQGFRHIRQKFDESTINCSERCDERALLCDERALLSRSHLHHHKWLAHPVSRFIVVNETSHDFCIHLFVSSGFSNRAQ